MKIKKSINLLESLIKNPKKGLPEDIFLFISRTTPMINVDLLIKNEKGETLLTWRDDKYYGPGWHIPGGIIRYKERIKDRIRKVARNELGVKVKFDKEPLAVNEVICLKRKDRGHFISLLYACKLINQPSEKLRYKGGIPKNGQWYWHNKYPKNMISVHNIYRKFINC